MTDAAIAPKKRTVKPKTVFQWPDGKPVSYKGINKFLRDVIRYHAAGHQWLGPRLWRISWRRRI